MEITKDKLAELKEQIYERARRQILTAQLSATLKQLGTSGDFTKEHLILEREVLIVQLRDVCDHFGDNDWNENIYLPDVIEKHLFKHLCRNEKK